MITAISVAKRFSGHLLNGIIRIIRMKRAVTWFTVKHDLHYQTNLKEESQTNEIRARKHVHVGCIIVETRAPGAVVQRDGNVGDASGCLLSL